MFLLSAKLPVRTGFGIKMDIHFIFIKDRMLRTTFVQCFVNYTAIFSSLCGLRIRRIGAALRHTSPANGNQRRERPAGNDFRPSTLDSVNQLIQRLTEERAQQSVLATSLTRALRCSISMAVSLRA